MEGKVEMYGWESLDRLSHDVTKLSIQAISHIHPQRIVNDTVPGATGPAGAARTDGIAETAGAAQVP